jgi:hypothetical protein
LEKPVKFAIEVLEQSGNWTELCRVASNPQAVAKAALAKTYRVKHTRRWWRLPLYKNVRIVEIGDAQT